ncbi:MAG: twin-arginine translocase TatA/TatE family subunit [Treponema sp.]|jgi:sec-independent protein translocase protein TatA|nr:twin-arginine translocase TatA/TatE family subunit [Treponema sp.]
MRIGITEIIIILAVAFLLFGGVKLTGLGKTLGRSIREFRDEVRGGKAKTDAEAADGGRQGGESDGKS